VAGQVKGGFDLDLEGLVAVLDAGQDLAARLHRPLGPAVLLGLEGVHLHRQFAGNLHLGQEEEALALQLGPVAQIQVLGEGVVLPAAGLADGRFTPDAGGAVEVEEAARAVAGGVLDDEVGFEEDGLDAGQKRVGPVEVAPAQLHHADLRIGELVDGLLEHMGGQKSASKRRMKSPRG